MGLRFNASTVARQILCVYEIQDHFPSDLRIEGRASHFLYYASCAIYDEGSVRKSDFCQKKKQIVCCDSSVLV